MEQQAHEERDGAGDGAFPAAIEAAWGLRPRPHKGPKRGLTLEGIVEAAVRIADGHGIDAVSMSRVAKELGVSTMALYRYVDTKDELVTLAVDTALGPPPPLAEGLGWRRGLEQWAAHVRDALLAHPWTLRVVTAFGPPATPHQLAWLDQSLAVLDGTGLTEGEKVGTSLMISGLVRSQATVEASLRDDPASGRRWAAYESFLRRVTGDGRLPALRAAIEAGVFSASADFEPAAEEDDFAYGLQRALDGIEARLGRPG
ncbi:TetR/AcrR family transcriptional regulator [Streptomyces sp. DSM 42041]|uniref:TetR/AcrR family transcriptional regulator n=1 Tax=Streptomyces hazeniae TaxID=3075538 RepID=A0ABU2P355_9ACTN|nr:TetR/AcrR family transcriptional regulator [Streptomyces sp. DSM 42041]MDT0382622.1 TetR/AcrR family transcriptional regulator [Streptomyces sp. DSM 42041]